MAAALKVVVVDDEQSTAVHLKSIIEEVNGVKVMGIANEGKEALRLVERLRPQVVFLEIEIPGLNGLEVARELAKVHPKLYFIFVTASPNYALAAFKIYSFDYILKPLDEKRIKKTMWKLKEKVFKEEATILPSDKKLTIQVNCRKVFVDVAEILFIESRKPNVLIKTTKHEYLVRGSLYKFEKILKKDFFRSHKGYLVNLKLIREVVPSGRTFEICLKSGDKVLLSREKEKKLREMIDLQNELLR